MNEFLLPAQYNDEAAGIAVMFAGLDEETYDRLELSIDGSGFFNVSRSEEEPFYSEPYSFPVKSENTVCEVYGRLTYAGLQRVIQCKMPSVTTKVEPAILYRRSMPEQHYGGGRTKPPALPNVEVC